MWFEVDSASPILTAGEVGSTFRYKARRGLTCRRITPLRYFACGVAPRELVEQGARLDLHASLQHREFLLTLFVRPLAEGQGALCPLHLHLQIGAQGARGQVE